MQCAQCRHENPPQAKFCLECGARFAAPQSYTPRHLAEKILTSRSALEGERKLVTVLFADLKGSMELLAGRDPEEARKVLDPVLEEMMEAVHRYEGTVNQVMGDGIMALFGAPLAHEDHALRACYAALRMQETVTRRVEHLRLRANIPVQIRVGLNSGEVVVRSIRSDLHMDYSAVGQTTHLAARMEQMAAPGTIRLTRATVALAEDFVHVAPLGPTAVKGLPDPIEVFELSGASLVRSRLHAAATRGLTRFVGREAERDVLREALERASEGHGQMVAIAGAAGLGKSRLIWELVRSPRARDWLVLEAGAVSYGKNSSYAPVIDLLKSHVQIEPRDDVQKIREKLTGTLLSLDPALEATLPALLALLDVPVDDPGWTRLDPPQRRRRTLDALKRLLIRASQVQPLLLVFEDLHWIDSETQALLDTLVDVLPTARVLLLVTYRPEYTHAWKLTPHYRQLRLDALGAGTADALLDELVGPAGDVGALKRLLIERSDGNPFFLEEAVRALVETGMLLGERGAYRPARPIRSLPLPSTAQAILATRIDRLDPEDKRLLQAAAVVGKDVPLALLQAITDEPEERLRAGLDRLQAAEFLYETEIFPDLEYTFKHALGHEVAYGSLLNDRRRALHAALVSAHEQVYADRLTEHVERLAHHATRGELWDRAVVYAHRAGRRCIERSAYRDALLYLDEAAAAAEQLPEGRERLERAIDTRLDLRRVLIAVGEGFRSFERLFEAEDLAQRLGDPARIAIVATRMTTNLWLAGQTEQAEQYARRALEHAEALGEPDLAIAIHYTVATAATYWGDFARAETHAQRVLALLDGDHTRARGDGLMFPAVGARVQLAAAWAEQGRFDEGIQIGEEAVRIAESLRHPYGIAHAIAYLAVIHYHRGDHADGVALCERGLDLGEQAALGPLLPFLGGLLGHARIRSGDVEAGLLAIRNAITAQTAMGFRYGLSLLSSLLSEGLLLAGRLDAAVADAERGMALAVDCSERRMQASCHQVLGDIASRRDPPALATAVASYEQGLAIATELGARPVAAHCHRGLGRLYQRAGDREQARQHLTAAAAMYREMGMTYWLEQTATPDA